MKNSLIVDANSGDWKNLLQERGTYHPEINYYMVDYVDEDHGAHIRLPFLRQEQVFQVCSTLHQAIENGAAISAMRVLPEAFLDEPYANLDIVEEAITAGVEDAKYWGATTREVLFDHRYEAIAKRFKSNALHNSEVQ